ncbi:MAG TPA: TetR family transcriptional regulator [Candidatus Limnocylindrales bacterium]|nr:TetR family transcriptional regulator [Candidatus Limnocylindrales bacterium]
MPRTGRRPGASATRDRILGAARASFAERGFDAASIRDVAARAAVDPALVHHYFGSKQRLFVAAMEWPIDPAVAIPRVAAGDIAGLGERLARFVVELWEDPGFQPVIVGLIRSAASDPVAARMLRELVEAGPLAALSGVVGGPEAELRAELVGSQLIGFAMARYILRVEPLASAERETVVALLAPTIQRYLAASSGSESSAPIARPVRRQTA